MFSICSGLEILPASRYAGSPPTQLNRANTSSTTPSRVGTICQSRRTTYANMSARVLSVASPAGDFVEEHPGGRFAAEKRAHHCIGGPVCLLRQDDVAQAPAHVRA